MALPTLSRHCWLSKGNIHERALIRRRLHEEEHRQKWNDASNYFKKSNVNASREFAWTSDKSYQKSLEAYNNEKQKEKKQANLRVRQDRLAELLRRDMSEYEFDLRQLNQNNSSLDDMKEKVWDLRSAREDRRKQVAQEKLYEHWRDNNPDLREIEWDQHREFVVNSWKDQCREQQEKLKSARHEQEEYDRELAAHWKKAEELEQHKEEERLNEQIKMKSILKEQIDELRLREDEAKELRQEQDEMLRQQWQLETIDSHRKALEEQRKKKQFGRVLLRQHKAKLQRRSKEVQEELETDRKILESLIKREQEMEAAQTSKKELARADAAWMKEVIEAQLKLEKAREAEMELLFQEEAAKMWENREMEWEKERLARERLMKEVLDERQLQIKEKMQNLQLQQEESLQRREELINEIDAANQLTKRDQEEAQIQRSARKQELEQQITARKEREEVLHKQQIQELKEQKETNMEYEAHLQQEAQKLRMGGFKPKNFSRRQAWT